MFAKLLSLLGLRRRATGNSSVVEGPWEEVGPLPSGSYSRPPQTVARTIRGRCHVIDGDTIVIQKTHIRLAGIDAPELDHPWGKKAKFAMVAMCKGKVITAEVLPEVSYDRFVAKCTLPNGDDLSAELVRQGLALDWKKFSGGKYRHLEPEGVRKKLWRVEARHRGKLRLQPRN